MADEIRTILELDINVNAAVKDAQKLKEEIAKLKTETDKAKTAEDKMSESYILAANQMKAYTAELRQKEMVIQKATTATKEYDGSLNSMKAELAKNTIAINAMSGATQEEINLRNEAIVQNKKLYDTITDLEQAQGNYTRQVGNYEVAAKSIRQEMKEMNIALVTMKRNGEDNTDQYKIMAQKLGDLKDSMRDVAAETKILGSDTKKIDMMAGSIGAAASAGSVFEGTMALVGAENENVVKSIQKMVAFQSIANGVQEVANALQKESGLMMGLNAVKTGINSAAQATYTTIVGTSTGALKAFRIAMAATGIGAIIALVVTLVMNWDKLTKAIGLGSDAADRYAKSMERINIESDIRRKKINDEIDALKAKGATDEQIAKKEADLYTLSMAQITAQIEQQGKLKAAKESELETANKQLEAIKILNAATFGANTLLVAAAEKRVSSLNDELIGIDNRTNSYKNSFTEQERLAKNFAATQDTKAKEKEAKDKEAKDKEIAENKDKYKQMLQDQNDAMAKSLELEKMRTQKIRDERLLNDGIYEAEKNTIEKFSKEEQRILDDQLKHNLISQQDYAIEKENIVIENQAQITELEIARGEAAVAQMSYELEMYKLNNQNKLENKKEVTAQDIEDEKVRLEDEYNRQIEYNELAIQNENDRNLAKEQLTIDLNARKAEIQLQFEEEQAALAAEKAATDYENEMVLLEDTLFAKLDLQKAALKRQENAELDAARKTGASVELIKKKYAKAERAIEIEKANNAMNIAGGLANSLTEIFGKQSKVGKAAAVAATIISTIQGAVQAFTGMISSIPGPVGIALGAVAAAGVAASGYANVQKILAVTPESAGSGGGGGTDNSISSAASSVSSQAEQARSSANAEIGQGIVTRSIGDTSSASNQLQTAIVIDEVTARQTTENNIKKTSYI